MIDTIIFDFGGVLVTSDYRKAVNNTKLPPEHIEYLAYKYYSTQSTKTDNMTPIELLKHYRSQLDKDRRKYANEALHFLLSATIPFKYTLPLLRNLKRKGYKLYYLSNWNKSGFESCKKIGIFDFMSEFDGGIVSYQVRCSKPEPRIYKLLIDKYSLVPKNCIFYDDMKTNVEAARRFGINGIVFTPDIVKSIRELPRIK